MADPETERLFFALWPDTAIRDALAVATAGSPSLMGAGRPVSAEHLHMTLAFLGEVQARDRIRLEEACGGVSVPAFRLVIDRLGWWRRTGVLWAGPREAPAELFQLVDALRAAAAGCGLPVDRRRFAAHVTLARKVRRGAGGDLAPPIPWDVDEFALVRSVLGSHGANYVTVARWSLGRPDSGGG